MDQAVQANPLSQDINAQVQTKLVSMEDVKFSFRTTRIKVKDETTGEEVEKDWKRPTFETQLPIPTTAGIIAALQAGDKTTELIKDAVGNVVIDRFRGIINEKIEADPSVELKVDMFDLGQLSLVAIANLPKSERGAGIPKEAWNAFVADYKQTMLSPAAVQLFQDKKPRSPEVLDKHGILLAGKFNQVRSRKDVIAQMDGFLDIWAQVSPNLEEHVQCYEHLKAKAKTLMQGETFEDL